MDAALAAAVKDVELRQFVNVHIFQPRMRLLTARLANLVAVSVLWDNLRRNLQQRPKTLYGIAFGSYPRNSFPPGLSIAIMRPAPLEAVDVMQHGVRADQIKHGRRYRQRVRVRLDPRDGVPGNFCRACTSIRCVASKATRDWTRTPRHFRETLCRSRRRRPPRRMSEIDLPSNTN